MHFEDIWNEAEELSEELNKQTQQDITTRMRICVDGLSVGIDTVQRRGEIIGELLFELCSYCKLQEKEGTPINSAAALRLVIDRKKEILG